jgi:hypothetical protein
MTAQQHLTLKMKNCSLKAVAGEIDNILWHCFTHHSSSDESAKE